MKRCPTCRRIYENQAAACPVDGTSLSDTTVNADPFVGQMVTPRYRLTRKLGGTGLGVVYQADEIGTGNQVAVKLLLTEIRRDVELVKQFWWEARLAAASSPAHVVRVYEVDRTEDGRVFIAMEYLAGDNLTEVIRREGPLAPDRALRLALQIAQGLAAASQAGVTHRNLKPQNIVLIGPEQLKLTDFGVGRLRETALGGRPTGPSLIAPEYLAPEQLKGEEVNFRADIYALGAVMYTMLTGSAPAGHTSELAPLRTLRPELPDAIDKFVMRTMERRPERRQGGMEEVIEALRALATGAASPMPSAAPAPRPAAPPPAPAVPEQVKDDAPMAGLLTLLRDVPRTPRMTDGATEPARPGRLQRLAARPWLGAVRQARTGLAKGSTRLLAWLLLLPALLRRLGAAAWRSIRGGLRQVRSAGSSRLGVWVERVSGLGRRGLGAVRQARTIVGRRPTVDLRASRLSSWVAATLTGRRVALYLWWSHRGRLILTAAGAVLVVGVTTWAVLDVAGGAKAKRPVPEVGTTAAVVEAPGDSSVAVQLRESENERRREEARAAAVRAVAQTDAAREQAELEASRRAEEARRRQAELEASRRAEDERRQAELEATRRAEEERRRQAELEASRRAEEEAARVRAEAARQIARPVEPAPARPVTPALSAADVARIRTQAEQKLHSRGLFRVSTADRWGVALDVGANGDVALSGTLRDMDLYNDAVRLVREVPGVQTVQATNVRVADMTAAAAPGDAARIRAEVQQRLRSRGLLRESSADRWGVAVEVRAGGEVTLVGILRDVGLQREAIRLTEGVPGVQQVKPEIRVP